MNYILLYWLIGSSAFAPTGTAIFADLPACQAALAAIDKTFPSSNTYDQTHAGVCVAQASQPVPPVVTVPQGF